jgi:hypothetical protein
VKGKEILQRCGWEVNAKITMAAAKVVPVKKKVKLSL